jgi:hypothetical protein
VKHLGVVSALSKENLLPRIICGTSAGSILAAAVCARDEGALVELLDPASPQSAAALLIKNRFFGLRRGFSSANLLGGVARRHSRGPSVGGMGEEGRPAAASSVDLDLKRGWRHLQQTSTLLDRRVLEDTILVRRTAPTAVTRPTSAHRPRPSAESLAQPAARRTVGGAWPMRSAPFGSLAARRISLATSPSSRPSIAPGACSTSP